jgi:hypothetical protein
VFPPTLNITGNNMPKPSANNHSAGASVPDGFMERLRREPAHRRRHTALIYAREVMAELREMRGVSGVLLFAMEDDVESLGELLCT